MSCRPTWVMCVMPFADHIASNVELSLVEQLQGCALHLGTAVVVMIVDGLLGDGEETVIVTTSVIVVVLTFPCVEAHASAVVGVIGSFLELVVLHVRVVPAEMHCS